MQITTIKDLVNAMGGAKAVAAQFDMSPTAVYMAIHRDSIPHRWRLHLHTEAKRKRLAVDPKLFGLEKV